MALLLERLLSLVLQGSKPSFLCLLKSLVNRGSITCWFSEDAIAKWYSVERTGKPGRPDTYPDSAIRCGLMIKAVFRTALRALQGFVNSLIESLGLDIVCPHYSVFSRRAKDLRIPLRKLLKPGEKLNVVFDSTGVKVFGEGEEARLFQA